MLKQTNHQALKGYQSSSLRSLASSFILLQSKTRNRACRVSEAATGDVP